MKIYIVGDLHGNWKAFNTLINKKRPDLILQCGDFGWWPKFHNTKMLSDEYYVDPMTYMMSRKPKLWDQYGIKNKNCTIYWCDGNHEDHWSLRDLVSKNGPNKIEVMPKVFYMPRGQILKLDTGHNILFMGGADSIDKNMRKLGVDWFPEEVISNKNIYELPENKIDIVVSHTCPSEMYEFVSSFMELKLQDPSHIALSTILNKYNPTYWFFAHFHKYAEGKIRNTKWKCLNTVPQLGWYQELKLEEEE